jgi:RimJ/RimL family protein N-acetyltransferase
MKVHIPDGHAFMAAVGATAGLRSVANRMTMAGLDWDELDRWRAHVSDAHPALQWEIHAPRAPMQRLAQLTPVFSRLLNEQPLGTLDLPPMRYEMKAYEAWYAEMDRRGGEHYLVMLRAGETLAAMCDAHWDPRLADRVFQQLTAVAAPWRGKGLAKAVKAAMLALVRERQQQVTMLVTTNAHANAPMLSINRRLGFVVQREECTYQMRLEAIAACTNAVRRGRE